MERLGLPTEAGLGALVKSGVLIPVQVFGGYNDPTDPDMTVYACPSCNSELEWGYGLADRCSTHAPSGSDCNRAAFFLLRPSDAAMADPALREALEAVLERPDEPLGVSDG